VLSSYSSRQQRDHATFGSDYDPTHPLTSDIPMTDRNQQWDAGADKPFSAPRGYGHVRQESVSSVTDYQYYGRGASYSSAGYGEYDDKGPNVSRGRTVRGNSYLDHPAGAHTVDPGPTPMFSESYYTRDNAEASDVNRPLPSQPHPGNWISCQCLVYWYLYLCSRGLVPSQDTQSDSTTHLDYLIWTMTSVIFI
jgi:hypothetical protein